MSTANEIAAAVALLPERERQALEAWIVAQQYGDDAALEKALTEAINEADASDEGQSPDEVRALIEQWSSVSKSAR